ncbi:efflux RND transporter periplasmic adaptor subunit [Lichenifustis flavocetrariae]|uniref:Efflux RND transporter periplasmic adaptor subunit n=1 Tax=Lichenifustis flavocetrariae TaxID=2949735 RepID=A0AA41Z382_9HYPH|nr:efflux RND transporter periplasmic adaptor subunit [Lichenifustis flavocetrariae]MCW6512058.1 efflux RND transporter periplasmic adaptor subunit [Lichenifustis flavocetrariae]
MSNAFSKPGLDGIVRPVALKMGKKLLVGSLMAMAVLAGPDLALAGERAATAPAPLPTVVVSNPVQGTVDSRLQFLGQFSAVDRVDLRPQVGGTLTEINFKDGDLVKKGDLLFVIDPTPYQIALDEAKAQLANARANLDLANRQFVRADSLKQSGYGTIEVADQRAAQQLTGQAAVQQADARVRDAQFDLDHTRITAPFTGRIGSHQVSVGSLISGSRTGTSATTLLATIVSLDTIYLNFDMSEADYLAFKRERASQTGPLADKVKIALTGDAEFDRRGKLDFIDNQLDRSSGTIHARATVPNADHFLTPGTFGRVRLIYAPAAQAMLLPDAAVLPDQSTHLVMTVDADGVVTPKTVEIGGLRNGLRVIRSGLAPDDKVITDGVATVRPGMKVAPHEVPINVADQTKG